MSQNKQLELSEPQGLIEDLEPEERGDKIPLDWDNPAELMPKGGFKVGELAVIMPKRVMHPTATDKQITLILEAEGKDPDYIASYIAGWRKRPFNKA